MTDTLSVVVLVAVVVVLVAWVLSYRATRIDRLHARIEGCWHALDAVLVRRSEALLELANAGALDPASALLLSDAASDTLEAPEDGLTRDDRVDRENELAGLASLLLAEATPASLAQVDPPLRATLEQAVRRVEVAAAFHNEAVSDVTRIRDQLVTKLACLAGKAPRHHPLVVDPVDLAPLVATPTGGTRPAAARRGAGLP